MRQLLAVLVVTVAACENQDLVFLDAPAANHDAPSHPGDTIAAVCPVATSLPSVTPMAQMAQDDVDPPNSLVYSATMNTDALPDGLAIQLSTGFGAFKSPNRIGPGTYPLSGEESSMMTCGACIRIRANVDASDSAEAVYMPLSGSLTITSVSGNFTGSLNNVLFRQVDIDGANLMTTDSPSHCKSTIGTLSFDKLLTVNGGP